VVGPNASAQASTVAESVSASASATAGPGSSAAYAYAEQLIWFGALDDGVVTFEMGFTINQTLSMLAGETASADASVGLTLFDVEGNMIGSESTFYRFNDVAGGYQYASNVYGPLTVSGYFEAEEM
jgi:hypothetical protein